MSTKTDPLENSKNQIAAATKRLSDFQAQLEAQKAQLSQIRLTSSCSACKGKKKTTSGNDCTQCNMSTKEIKSSLLSAMKPNGGFNTKTFPPFPTVETKELKYETANPTEIKTAPIAPDLPANNIDLKSSKKTMQTIQNNVDGLSQSIQFTMQALTTFPQIVQEHVMKGASINMDRPSRVLLHPESNSYKWNTQENIQQSCNKAQLVSVLIQEILPRARDEAYDVIVDRSDRFFVTGMTQENTNKLVKKQVFVMRVLYASTSQKLVLDPSFGNQGIWLSDDLFPNSSAIAVSMALSEDHSQLYVLTNLVEEEKVVILRLKNENENSGLDTVLALNEEHLEGVKLKRSGAKLLVLARQHQVQEKKTSTVITQLQDGQQQTTRIESQSSFYGMDMNELGTTIVGFIEQYGQGKIAWKEEKSAELQFSKEPSPGYNYEAPIALLSNGMIVGMGYTDPHLTKAVAFVGAGRAIVIQNDKYQYIQPQSAYLTGQKCIITGQCRPSFHHTRDHMCFQATVDLQTRKMEWKEWTHHSDFEQLIHAIAPLSENLSIAVGYVQKQNITQSRDVVMIVL